MEQTASRELSNRSRPRVLDEIMDLPVHRLLLSSTPHALCTSIWIVAEPLDCCRSESMLQEFSHLTYRCLAKMRMLQNIAILGKLTRRLVRRGCDPIAQPLAPRSRLYSTLPPSFCLDHGPSGLTDILEVQLSNVGRATT